MPRLERLLVPLDGSRLAEAVLPVAFALAARCGASVTLLHVVEHDAPETVHGQPHLDDPMEATAYLDGLARTWAGTVPVDLHVHPNPEHDVARSIAGHADELDTDLVVLATHGSGGLRGFLFGRIAQQVLRYTRTPVLLVRPLDDGAASAFDLRSLLVPLDGSADAEAALPLAALLARATGAAVHLVRVVPTLGTVTGKAGPTATFSPAATAALLEIEEQQARDDLAAVGRHALPGLRVTAEVRRGDVVAELTRAVEAHGADMVVLSTHGRSGLAGFFTGSVAARLLPRVEAPLLLIRVEED